MFFFNIFLIFLYGCSKKNSKNDITIGNIDIQYNDKKENDKFFLCPPDLSCTSFAGDKFETITIGFSRILQGLFPVYGYAHEEPTYISLEIPSMMIESDEYYGTTDYQKHRFSINEVDDIPSAIIDVRIQEFLDMNAPSLIKFNTDHFICGNTFRCVWALREYRTCY